MIYCSTGGYYNKSAYTISKNYISNGIKNIELSGGIYSKNLISNIKKLSKKYNFIAHNYFPPPKKKFVINLASCNKEIVKRSMQHITKSILLSSKLNAHYFSFHAGFRFDPIIKDLGKNFNYYNVLNNRERSLSNFILNVNKLAKIAKEEGITLLIENNVLTKANFKTFKDNPLLMVDEKECQKIMSSTSSNVGLLIDLGHLKVSSKTLKFDKINFLKKCDKWIKGYHLSENNGIIDNNMPFNSKSWFWKNLKKNLNFYVIEVYNISIIEMIGQIKIAKNKL
tara:strand:- start:2145 stop:2990 length:846 start_codon:yes stop_codon:yes gene_type:complete